MTNISGFGNIDFTSQADANSKRHYVPKDQQVTLNQFDKDNDRADRLAEMRKQRAKDRAKRMKEQKNNG